MRNVRYDYSSVHVDVSLPLHDEIVKWGRANVRDEEIYVTQKDPTFGREDEIHITILYGLHTEEPDEVIKLLEKQGPVKVKLGQIGVFTNPYKFDVVMIEAISDELRRFNELLTKNVKYSNKYGVYNPHVTIAYVKKGKGWKFNRTNVWEGREFTCNYAVFSSKNGLKEKIIL